MAQEVPTLFTKFILTDEEELAGTAFSTSQRCVMQNLIAQAAEEKVRLTFDPLNPNAFIQREAELQGAIITLSNLLARNEELTAAMAVSASQQ